VRTLARNAWWGALFLLLLLAPVPIACVNTEWRMPLAVACLVLGGTGVLASGRLRLPLALAPLAGFVAWAALQLLPLSEALMRLISVERASLPPPPGGEASLPVSVNAGATLEQALLVTGLFYVVWALAQRPSRAPFRMLAVVGVVHAAFACVLSLTGGTGSSREGTDTITRVLWVYEWPEIYTPIGTYVNKNHFAGLMVISAGGCLAIAARRWASALRRVSHLGRRSLVAAITERGFFRVLPPTVAFLIVFLAVFASGSRAAAAALVAALVGAVVYALVARQLPAWVLALSLVMIGAVAVTATFVGTQSVLDRLVPKGRYLNRPRLWRDTLEMTSHYPVAGTGLGTYPYIFPRHQTFDPERNFSHAESDCIQYLSETGVVGFGLLLAFGALVCARLLRLLRASGKDRAMVAGVAVGVVGIVLHGMVDVNLHIPANMLAAAVLFGGLLGFEAESATQEPVKSRPEHGGSE
jgi:hypothetical protein